jgi:chemotaxis protein methyltransferase WspC
VGPSEGGVLLNHGFVSAQIPLAFAFRNAPAMPPSSGDTKLLAKKTGDSARRIIAAKEERGDKAVPIPTDRLEFARQLTDQGQLDKATEICLAHIHDHGPTAQAFYLLGLAQDAGQAREQAREFYRKALYLQPDHYEALVHLALLTQTLGDQAAARVLQERAERAKQGGKT